MNIDKSSSHTADAPVLTRDRIDDCRELYLKYGGGSHEQIEREMRALGHHDFHRRILYRRFERGRKTTGWIERFGWERLLRKTNYEIPITDYELPITNYETPITNHELPITNYELPITRIGKEKCVSVPSDDAGGSPDTDAAIRNSKFEIRNSDSPDEFHAWLKTVSPDMDWDARHLRHICKQLKQVYEGKCQRLMIFTPPRHGKSELVTVRYAAWRLKQDPSLNVIIGSYNQGLADKFSRRIRRILARDWFLSQKRSSEDGESSAAGPSENTSHSASQENTQDQTNGCSQTSTNSTNSDCPFPFISERPKNSVSEWETTMGGGLRAVGVGGGVTGYGAALIIIDDPVKSRAEAESKTYRDKVWEWFRDDIYSRLEPNAAMVLIQTRWHEDDLAGRLLREMDNGGEHWDVVSLPAIAEAAELRNAEAAELRNADCGMRIQSDEHDQYAITSETSEPDKIQQNQDRCSPTNPHSAIRDPQFSHSALRDPQFPHSAIRIPHSTDPLNRPPGEALWPERFDIPVLERKKAVHGSYAFAALYQQRPVPSDGGIFKREWFEKVISYAPPGLKWCRGYDLAISTKTTADHTASFRAAFDKAGNLYIDGGFRKRMEFPEQRRYILGRIMAERDTRHGIELALHGQAILQDLRREPSVRGRSLCGVRVTKDKVARAHVWSPLAEEGKLFLIRGPWIAEFVDEACSFPLGTHNDQIDAVSIAVQMLSRRGSQLHTF